MKRGKYKKESDMEVGWFVKWEESNEIKMDV